MHLLIANVFFAPHSYGGATVVAEAVARGLLARGLRISAVSSCQRADLAPYTLFKTEVAGIENYVINLPPERSPSQLYDNPEVTARLSALIADLAPDLLHAHCLQDLGVGVLDAARDQGVPAVLSVHDYWWICARQFMIRADHRACQQDPVRIDACRGCAGDHWGLKLRQRQLFEAAQQVALVTYPSAYARDLCERSGFAPGRGVIWENGIAPPGPDFEAMQAARRAQDPRLSFGYLGGPSDIKGWPQIRAAFAEIERADFTVHLVDGSLDGSWWRAEDLAALPGDWRIVPRFDQGQADGFYAGIDVLLFPSQWRETFGLVLREALARGIAVIQTDCGGGSAHGQVPAADLIPIGAPPEALRGQILRALKTGPQKITPVPVTFFADQAAQFETLARQVVAGPDPKT